MSFLDKVTQDGYRPGAPVVVEEPEAPVLSSPFRLMLSQTYTIMASDPDPLASIEQRQHVTKGGRQYSTFVVHGRTHRSLVSAQRALVSAPPSAAPRRKRTRTLLALEG